MSAMAFVSCKGKPKDMIVNKWKMTDMTGGVVASMPDSAKKSLLAKMSIEFTKDGKYMTAGDGPIDNGTYTVAEDGKSVTITSEKSGKPESNDIEEISKSKLVLLDKSSGTKVTLEPK